MLEIIKWNDKINLMNVSVPENHMPKLGDVIMIDENEKILVTEYFYKLICLAQSFNGLESITSKNYQPSQQGFCITPAFAEFCDADIDKIK